jgi:hypothetical protein
MTRMLLGSHAPVGRKEVGGRRSQLFQARHITLVVTVDLLGLGAEAIVYVAQVYGQTMHE